MEEKKRSNESSGFSMFFPVHCFIAYDEKNTLNVQLFSGLEIVGNSILNCKM